MYELCCVNSTSMLCRLITVYVCMCVCVCFFCTMLRGGIQWIRVMILVLFRSVSKNVVLFILRVYFADEVTIYVTKLSE